MQQYVAPPDPTRQTRASHVAATLREHILCGKLAPGSRINLDALRVEFGVSLSPLREAISRLVSDDLISTEDHRGYRVAMMSLQNLHDVTLLRADSACLALSYAISGANVAWEGDILAALHRADRAPIGAPMATAKLRAGFHMTLIHGCDMPLLTAFASKLLHLGERYQRVLGSEQPAQATHATHHAIADAAIARHAATATSLLRAHILETGAALAKRLQDAQACNTSPQSPT